MAAYNSLNPLGQRIMQVVALAYRVKSSRHYYGFHLSGSYSELHRNLMLQLAKDNGGKPLSENDFARLIQSLIKLGLLDDDQHCSVELAYSLGQIALTSANCAATLPLITADSRYNPRPQFMSSYKFELANPDTFSQDDLRSLNLAMQTNNGEVLQSKWSTEAQLEILADFRHLFGKIQLDNAWIKSRAVIFQQILCVVKLGDILGNNQVTAEEHHWWREFFFSLPQLPEWKNFPLLNVYLNQLNIC